MTVEVPELHYSEGFFVYSKIRDDLEKVRNGLPSTPPYFNFLHGTDYSVLNHFTVVKRKATDTSIMLLPEDVANKLAWLRGPHAEALLKAWLLKRGSA